ncbi:32088_t:CDS:2, partial [Gigaspora margarita]
RRKESHLNTEKLSKILEIEFNNTFILYNTDINFKFRQFNKAISDLDIAIKFKPNDIEMLILRGKTYFFLVKYVLALFDFIKADDILINYKFDEWIKNLENSDDLDETKKQFLDKNKYSKESNDHKYKSKYFQRDTNSLLMLLS